MLLTLPYLSIVATARNDNHGGNLLRRMQIFVSGVLAQSERHRVPLELILVEWNPPAERPKLVDALKWPDNSSFADVRIVEVPPLLHNRYEHAARLPLYQMIAKNVGIRRARAPYILATNIDILFSDELFEYFLRSRLESNRMYRVDRHDVDENLPQGLPISAQLEYCRHHLIRVNHMRGCINLVTGDYHRHRADDWEEHLADDGDVNLHTNACGDFQLMHRKHWFQLRGYPEFDMFSFHLDSVLEYMAHFAGVQEVNLGEPYRIYHVEHQSGWTPEVNKSGVFDKRYEQNQIRKLSDEDFWEHVLNMKKKQAPTIFNDAHWGLSTEDLPETSLYS